MSETDFLLILNLDLFFSISLSAPFSEVQDYYVILYFQAFLFLNSYQSPIDFLFINYAMG